MSLQLILEKIKSEAQTEAQSIIARAESHCAEIEQETIRKKAEILASFKVSLDKQKTQHEIIIRSSEKQRINLDLQTKKRELLDKVYKEAFVQILNLPHTEYVQLLLSKYQSQVPKDLKITSILAPEARLAEINEVAKDLNWKAEVIVSSKINSGCILVGSNFEYNLSIEHLFDEERSSSEIEVAQILFPKAK